MRVIRSLLSKPKTVYRIAADTGLPERTVKAQITALRKSEAVRVQRRIPSPYKQGGSFAVYEPIVVEIK